MYQKAVYWTGALMVNKKMEAIVHVLEKNYKKGTNTQDKE